MRPLRYGRNVVLSLLLMVPAMLVAQSQATTGTIEGNTFDQTGAVLPGATVTIRNPATGVVRTVASDEKGYFRAPLLPPGSYQVTAELSGFARLQRTGLTLSIGQAVNISLKLQVAGGSETVTVSGEGPVVETTRTQISSTVNERAIAGLPVNGRNFIDFVLLTPGVTRDVRTGDISFAGQRGTLNSLVIDGADNNNTFFGQTLGRTGSGRAPYQFSQDAVKEFQVNSNGYSAEFGRAGGAVINVVTKSGENAFHGSGFWYYRDRSLNANDLINKINAREKSPYHFNQFGGDVSGPIKRDRAFFFFDYDGQRNTQPNLVFLNLPASIPSDADTQTGLQILQGKSQSWNRTQDQDVYLVKTDFQLNTNNRLSVRYNHQNFTGEGFENGGPQNSLEHTGASLVKTDTLNVAWHSILSPTFLNEFRFQYARDKEPGLANSSDPEVTVLQGGQTVLVIGRNFFSPRDTTIQRGQFADNISHLRGNHNLKIGVDLNIDRILNFFPGNFSGAYRFTSLAGFSRGRPTGPGERYVQAFPGGGTTGATTRPNILEFAVFFQDDWRVSRSLTLNFRRAVRPSVLRAALDKESGPAACQQRDRHERSQYRRKQRGSPCRVCLEAHARRESSGVSRRLWDLLRTHSVDHGRDRPLQQRPQCADYHLHRRHRAYLAEPVDVHPERRGIAQADHLRFLTRLRESVRAAGELCGGVGSDAGDLLQRNLPLRQGDASAEVPRHKRGGSCGNCDPGGERRHDVYLSPLPERETVPEFRPYHFL